MVSRISSSAVKSTLWMRARSMTGIEKGMLLERDAYFTEKLRRDITVSRHLPWIEDEDLWSRAVGKST
jgi:hypothetical protein